MNTIGNNINKIKPVIPAKLRLSEFHPKLRKLATLIIDSYDKPITLKDACLELGYDYRQIRILKSKYNVKLGKDLDLYIYQQRLKPIKDQAFQIYSSVAEGAISGKLGQQRLAAELLGDVKDRLEIDHQITGLFAVFSPSASQLPSDLKDRSQTIDVEYED